jgi:hypothetical protein
MKKKLLVTTAISTIALSSFALAETKVTGSLDVNLTTRSGSGTGAASDRGFGRESQINVQNSGDLNNGMGYAAGFSLEFDGGSEGSSTSNENVYIDFINGDTTLSLSVDHGLHTDSSAVPRASIPANSLIYSGEAYRQGAEIGAAAGSHVKEAFGAYVGQKFDAGTIQVRFVPQFASSGGNNDQVADSNEGSAYDVNYQGNMGIEGLKLNLQYAKADKAASSTHTSSRDSKGKAASFAYNFGQFSVGAGKINRELGTSATAERDTVDYGATFAVNDNLTVGLNYAETEVDNGNNDEEITMLQVAYSLGPVGVAVSYADIENLGGAANTDEEVGSIRFSTKF